MLERTCKTNMERTGDQTMSLIGICSRVECDWASNVLSEIVTELPRLCAYVHVCVHTHARTHTHTQNLRSPPTVMAAHVDKLERGPGEVDGAVHDRLPVAHERVHGPVARLAGVHVEQPAARRLTDGTSESLDDTRAPSLRDVGNALHKLGAATGHG